MLLTVGEEKKLIILEENDTQEESNQISIIDYVLQAIIT